MVVSIAEAKTDLSKLIRMIEDGREEVIWICRYDRRVAKITGVGGVSASGRIGAAKGKLKSPDNLDMYDTDTEKAGWFSENT